MQETTARMDSKKTPIGGRRESQCTVHQNPHGC